VRNRGAPSRPDENGADEHEAVEPQSAGGEAGSTLPEVLVALFILTSAVMVMVAGMSTLLVSATQNRQSTTAGVVARDYAEALELAVAQPNAWCSATYSVSFTPPTGYPVTAVPGTCPVNNSTTPQFQTVAITVGSPDGGSELLRVAVRQP